MRCTHALVRPPAATFAQGLTASAEGPPDHGLALEQHAGYCAALTECGVEVVSLPADAEHPDSTFIEDTAVITPRGAIIARPGAPSRRGETAAVAEALLRMCEIVATISEPGTLDGGDVCEVGDRYLIGLSERTNRAGAEQLVRALVSLGYRTTTVDIGGIPGLLHLKTGLAWLGERRLLAWPELAEQAALRGYEVVTVSEQERYAANCVQVNGRILVPAGYPETAERLAGLGCQILPLEMSEFRKMDGGVSCLSLRVPVKS